VALTGPRHLVARTTGCRDPGASLASRGRVVLDRVGARLGDGGVHLVVVQRGEPLCAADGGDVGPGKQPSGARINTGDSRPGFVIPSDCCRPDGAATPRHDSTEAEGNRVRQAPTGSAGSAGRRLAPRAGLR
jgi:hypothetical protein